MHVARPSAAPVAAVPVTFAAFDLLRIAARSITASPYQQRRALLSGLDLGTGVLISPVFPGPDAHALFEAVRLQNREGIVAKRSARGTKRAGAPETGSSSRSLDISDRDR
jgi:bifunctional non-homologous end joining protein LigD